MTTTRARGSSRPRLGLEFLEGRIVPAVVVTQLDIDGDGAADDIRIVGDLNKNAVTIQDNGAGLVLVSVDANRDGDTTDPGELTNAAFNFAGNSGAIEVSLGAGNDAFSYTLTGNLSGAARSISVNLGAGHNLASIGTGTSDVLGGSRFDAEVVAGSGYDTLQANFDGVDASVVSLRADLGLANDTATIAFGNIDHNASVDVDVNLGDGVNNLQIDLAGVGKFDQADVHVDVAGGAQRDVVNVNLHDDVGDGTIRSSLQIDVSLLGGNDAFTAGLDYGGLTFRVDDHSVASIAVRGGAGNDSLGVQGNGATGSVLIDADALLDIDLKGGLGDDVVGVNLGKTDALNLAGGIRLRLDGGAGNDSLTCLLGNTIGSTGFYDVVLLGGAGNDTAVFALPSVGTPTFGPTGKILLEGGRGIDALTNTSPAVSTSRFFESIL